MPHEHNLKIYLKYDLLFISDFRFTLRQLERAYNVLQAAELGRRRIPLSERMTVEQMATGQSVEVIIAAGFGLLALIRVSERVFQARKTAWESEKAKWDAKTAQLEYEERTEAIEERPRLRLSPEEQAESLIAGLVDTLALRGNVTSIELQLEGKILRLGTSVPNERDSSKNPPT